MTTTGPNSAGTGASDNGNGGTASWSNPGNITVSDNTRASSSVAAGATTEWLKATNLGFAITASDTIDGILVEIEKRSNTAAVMTDVDVKIVKGGTVQGNNKAEAPTWPTTDAYSSYGGSADLWGVTWTATDVNSSTFGVVISCTTSTNALATVDHVRITITHTAAGSSQAVRTMHQVRTRA